MKNGTAPAENQDEFRDLMQRAQAGDSKAYSELLMTLSRLFKGYFLNRLGSNSEIDDISQNTLMAIHRVRHTYDPKRPFLPWAFSIAKYKMVDHLRKQGRRISQEVQLDPSDWDAIVSAGNEEKDTTDLLNRIVNDLPPRQQKIIYALKVEGKSVKEISRELGISESAVKVTAHRSYKKLKKKIGEAENENAE